MIRRSLTWVPFLGYTWFALLFGILMTVAVVGVYLCRNPSTGMWAVFFSPLYLGAFFVVAELVVVALVLIRPAVARLSEYGPTILAVGLAAISGALVGYVFWWCLEFEAPPVGVTVVGVVGTAAAFGWYSAQYEFGGARKGDPTA